MGERKVELLAGIGEDAGAEQFTGEGDALRVICLQAVAVAAQGAFTKEDLQQRPGADRLQRLAALSTQRLKSGANLVADLVKSRKAAFFLQHAKALPSPPLSSEDCR